MYLQKYQILKFILRGADTLSGEATLSKWFCLPSEKGSTLKGENLLPFRVDPYSEGYWHSVKQTGSHKTGRPNLLIKHIQYP